jgi:hypothetical protein
MEDEWRERPVDRLHALACAQVTGSARQSKLSSLGVSIIALKAANRPDEYARAIDRLADCLTWVRPKPSSLMRVNVARQAVMEHCVDFCPACKGTGEVKAEEKLDGTQPMKACPECGGHGKRRYSDEERRVNLLLEAKDYRKGAALMAEAMGYIAMAEDQAIRTAARLLERW